MTTRRAILGWLAAVLAIGAAPATAQTQAPLTVFAAASLTNVLQDVGRAYTARTGQPVRFSFASSGVIARQIAGGAKADLVFSADPEWMDDLLKRGAIVPSTRIDLLRGRLALVAPTASTLALPIRRGFPIAAALGPRGRLAIGDPAYVPAGLYARTALQRLGVWDSVAARTLPSDNVRVALAYVARGEAPLGIVYETDAAIEPGVRVVGLFPEASHPPIVYPVAIVKGAMPDARRFYAFARSAQAAAIFARYRFHAAR